MKTNSGRRGVRGRLAEALFSTGIFWAGAAGCASVVTIHPASAMVHIGGVNGVMPAAASTYTLQMVRHEREGVQFAVISEDGATTTVHSASLEIPPGAPAARLYRVLAVNHTAPPTNGMFVIPPRNLGLVPDVLMPMDGRPQDAVAVGVKAGDVPLTYYVEFASTPETPPGAYPCAVVIASDSGTVRLEVTVTVAAITLPTRLPFRSATCWNWSLQDYYGRALAPAEKERFWRFCLEQRLSPCAFFGKAPDPAPSDLAGLQGDGVSLTCLMQVSGRKPRLLSDKDKEKYGPLLTEWRADLLKLGFEHDAVVLLTDEPVEGTADICRQNAKWFKEQFPELKMWCATRPGAPWDDFVNVFDTVTAHSTDIYRRHSHSPDALAAFRLKMPFPQGEYWWFHSVEPYAPYANVRLDNRPIEARVAGWQGAQAKVDGYEYFWITDWSGNMDIKSVPWPERAAKWKTGLSGAGTLCYPDESMRPMPSLRLVNLRDGLEDWALIEMLSPRVSRKEDPAGLAGVTKSVADYTTDARDILKARDTVIELLCVKHTNPESHPAIR